MAPDAEDVRTLHAHYGEGKVVLLDMQYKFPNNDTWYDCHSGLKKDEMDFWLWFYSMNGNCVRCVPHDPNRTWNPFPLEDDNA